MARITGRGFALTSVAMVMFGNVNVDKEILGANKIFFIVKISVGSEDPFRREVIV